MKHLFLILLFLSFPTMLFADDLNINIYHHRPETAEELSLRKSDKDRHEQQDRVDEDIAREKSEEREDSNDSQRYLSLDDAIRTNSPVYGYIDSNPLSVERELDKEKHEENHNINSVRNRYSSRGAGGYQNGGTNRDSYKQSNSFNGGDNTAEQITSRSEINTIAFADVKAAAERNGMTVEEAVNKIEAQGIIIEGKPKRGLSGLLSSCILYFKSLYFSILQIGKAFFS